MFSLFKNKIDDESTEEQRADIENYPPEIKSKILNGLACDQLPNATGDFGTTATNPIPVNGVHGEMKYLNRLRSKNGTGFFFHRLGSFEQKGFENNLDAYEIVSFDGLVWDVLYFEMYHPQRSKLLPKGYSFAEFSPVFSKTIIGSGVHELDATFPKGIPNLLGKAYGSVGVKIGEKLKTNYLDKHVYNPPKEHIYKVLLTNSRIGAIQDQVPEQQVERQQKVEVTFMPTYKPNLKSKKEEDIKNIDISKIKLEFGTPNHPDKDEKLIDLFSRAHKKEINVYVGDVYMDHIKPFCSYKPEQKTLDNIKDRYLEYIEDGDPQYVHVYPEKDVFIMSDDYAAYYTYLNAGLKTAPCVILGDTDSKFVINKRKVNWSLDSITFDVAEGNNNP